jgi:ABC-type antimicrobial peptide transport system permease subunit
MRWPMVIRNRVRPVWWRTQVEEDLEAELHDHFELEVEDGIQRGLTPEQAIARAYPNDVDSGTQIHLVPSGLVGKSVRDPVKSFSLVLFAMAGVGLHLACLVLSATGLFSLVAFAVARRRREIALRLALGATGQTVLRSLLLRTIALCGAGMLAGLALALMASQSLRAILYGVAPHDTQVFLAAV